jgi:hypothetical protein
VVTWDEKTVEGQPEPKHPAPSFTTTAEDGTAAAPAEALAPASQVSGESDGGTAAAWGIGLGAGGLILGAVALGLVLTGRRSAATK